MGTAGNSSRGFNKRLRSVEHRPRRGDRFINRRDCSVELLLVDRFQNLADARAGFQTQLQQMTAEENRPGRFVLDAQLALFDFEGALIALGRAVRVA